MLAWEPGCNSRLNHIITGSMRENGGLPPSHQDEPSTGTLDNAAAHRLIQQLDRFLHILNITHEGVICVDDECNIAVFNQGAEKLFGYKAEEIVGHPVTTLVCRRFRSEEKHRLVALTRIARESRMGFTTEKIVAKRKNGERFPCELSLSQGSLPGHRIYTLIVRDVTQRLNQEKELAYKSEHDLLTDLPNRTLLNERLASGIARADRNHRKLGVIYLDLDQFKPINDQLGHEVGDCLLQTVALRLRNTMRRIDTVSRIGGDEFIVCLEQIRSEQDAIAASDKLTEALEPNFSILGHPISVAASIGIAIYPDHGDNADELLRHADQAMYRAKEMGHSLAVYNAQQHSQIPNTPPASDASSRAQRHPDR